MRGSPFPRVYDYIDVNAAMLEKMYHKRLRGYASIGYSVLTDQDAGLGGDVIYDQVTFQSKFLQDVAQAKQSVLIFSPFATPSNIESDENGIRRKNTRCVAKVQIDEQDK